MDLLLLVRHLVLAARALHVDLQLPTTPPRQPHPGGNPGANIESISHRFYFCEVAFEWELTKETIYLPLGCLHGGLRTVHEPEAEQCQKGIDRRPS